jgi:hypothetical protein
MGVIRNTKHEAFAQALARGENAVIAYVLVGYKEHHQNAYRLAQHDAVRARVDEILMRKDAAFERSNIKAAHAAAVDKTWVMKRMVREAENADRASERVRALELVGKELGMFINRSVSLDISADFANLDNAEAILAAVAKELGDDTAATLRALVAPRKAPTPMRTIEHDPHEVLDADLPAVESPAGDCNAGCIKGGDDELGLHGTNNPCPDCPYITRL